MAEQNRFRDRLMAANTPSKMLKVRIDEWDRDVWVRTMTAAERDNFDMGLVDNREMGKSAMTDMRARLTMYCAAEEDGTRMFEPGDEVFLRNEPSSALQPIFDVAIRLNKLTQADIDELAKNSGSGPAAASS